MARRQEPGANPSEIGTPADGQLGWGRGAALAGLVSQAVEQGEGLGRGEKGKFPSRTRKLVRPLWTAAGARVRVDTGRGSLAPSAASPVSCTQLAVFQPAGVQEGAEPGVRCAWSQGGPAVFAAKANTSKGPPPYLFCKEQPLQPLRVGPWEKGGCLVNLLTITVGSWDRSLLGLDGN